MTNKNRELRKKYWREFYRQRHSLVPSQFCAMVASEINSHSTVVDWGSGNGRDSLFFAAQGHRTVALDLSAEAVKISKQESMLRGLNDRVQFLQGDVSSSSDVENAVQIARNHNESALVFYSRFVLHSLDEAEEDRFLTALSGCMKRNERVFFEFRSKEDAERYKHYPDHYRRYLDTDKFQLKLCGDLGFFVEYAVTGSGMAKYKQEDPFVSRVFAKKI